jgi:hypothetical protein
MMMYIDKWTVTVTVTVTVRCTERKLCDWQGRLQLLLLLTGEEEDDTRRVVGLASL